MTSGKRSLSAGLGIPILAFAVMVPCHLAKVQAAPNGAAIMRATASNMAGLRTYRSTMQTVSNFGGQSSVGTQEMAMLPPSGKMRMTMTQKMMGRTVKNIMVSDGTTVYSYSDANNQYMKMPYRRELAKQQLDPMGALGSNSASYKWLRTAKIGGRNTDVIQVIPKRRITPGMGTSTVLVYIDQGTRRMKQMEMRSSFTGPGKKKSSMSMKMTVLKETINAPIPASTFKFTPPPGAKEMKMPVGFGGSKAKPRSPR